MKNGTPQPGEVTFLVTMVGRLRQEIKELHDEKNKLHKENKAMAETLRHYKAAMKAVRIKMA